MNKANHYLVVGRVQGVGFRAFTARRAEVNGVFGWVRNLKDGRVEVLAQGPSSEMETFEKELHQGPRFGRVDEVTVQNVSDASTLNDFKILPDAEEIMAFHK